MDIKERVCNVLNAIGLPYGFVSKDEGEKQFIVYNINQNKGYKYYDDEEKVTQFKITINLFSVSDFTEIQNKIERSMLDAGFTKDYYPACIYIESMDIFNQPMYFNYYEEGEY